MVILCGIDESTAAREAARAAAALARRSDQELELLYVQDTVLVNAGGPDAVASPLVAQELLDADRRRVRGVLEPLRDELARESGVRVGLTVGAGLPDRELVELAQRTDASLIVVGAVSRRRGSPWRLGSVADRLSQTSPVPVLVVREAQSILRWTAGERPLRMVLALASGATGERATELAGELARLGTCEVIEAHVYDPRHEAHRLGVERQADAEARATIERALARELPERARAAGLEDARFVAVPANGHVAATLVELVERERADLIVVGARGRGAIERRFLGSVSYGVVGLSPANVIVARRARSAPTEQREHAPRTPAVLRSVLVATDLSETGDRAVDFGLALLPAGGRLTLLNVLPAPLSARAPQVPLALQPTPEERRMALALARAELEKLVPREGPPVETHVEVIEALDPALAILQTAERDGADVVVLGRHGHGPVAAALIGSVARAVAQRCPRPVLLVPHAAEA